MPARPRDLLEARDVVWQRVDSSNVHSALFNEDEAGLYVRFLRSGPDDIYVYPNRSRDEWEDFMTATSKGSWIWDNPIDEGWPYELLTTRDFSHVAPDDLRRDLRRFLK